LTLAFSKLHRVTKEDWADVTSRNHFWISRATLKQIPAIHIEVFGQCSSAKSQSLQFFWRIKTATSFDYNFAEHSSMEPTKPADVCVMRHQCKTSRVATFILKLLSDKMLLPVLASIVLHLYSINFRILTSSSQSSSRHITLFHKSPHIWNYVWLWFAFSFLIKQINYFHQNFVYLLCQIVNNRVIHWWLMKNQPYLKLAEIISSEVLIWGLGRKKINRTRRSSVSF